jgi:glycolate oxidase FAD binding subunit
MRPVALTLSAAGGAGHRLHARFAGSREGVERMVTQLGWPRLEADPPLPVSPAWARVSVPAVRLAGVLAGIPGPGRWIALPGVGVAHWLDASDAAAVGQVRGSAEAAGGSLVLMAAPLELKQAVGAWGAPPRNLEMMRRLRDAFDPGRTISPGRYLV